MKYNKFLIIPFIIGISITGCSSNKQTKSIDTIKTNDLYIDSNEIKFQDNTELLELSRNYNLAEEAIEILRDSLNKVNIKLTNVSKSRDSIRSMNILYKDKLGVAEYKLLRIREYNRIAAKGNNIKFLRSWINRTINK